MDRNSKILSLISLAVVVGGITLVWFGFKLQPEPLPWEVPARFIASPQATPGIAPLITSELVIEGEEVKVTRVIDGDTIEIEGRVRVRYLGVDTPETVDPRRPVECFGKEAKAENKSLVEGRKVILEKDVSETDKYHRLLRYVFLPMEAGKTLFVNDYLIRQGFAKTLTFPPDVKYSEQFLGAQREARQFKKGLWTRC